MRLLKIVTSSAFLRQNAILFIGAVVVGALNYLFYPVVGRLLSPTAFGEVQVIFSLFLQITLFLTVLSVVTVFVVANTAEAVRRNRIILELEKAAVWVAVVLLIATVLFGDVLRAFFQFESSVPFILLALLLVISVPFTFRTAFLRGTQHFTRSVIANLVAAAGKFVFALPFVLIGMGSSGALAGVAIGQAAAAGYGAWQARHAGLTRPADLRAWAKPDVASMWPELKYGLFVLAGSLAITLQLTVDTLVVKHLFDSHTAGLYAGVVTVARTIYFLTAPITMALLPSVKVSAQAKDNRTQLLKSLVLFAAIGVPMLAVMFLFPQPVTTLLMGGQYAEVSQLLPLLAIATFATSLQSVVVSYFLALKRGISILLAIMGFAATFGLMLFHHGSLQAIAESLFVGSMVSISLIAVWLVARTRLTSRGSNDETTTTIHRGAGAQ